MHRNGRWLKTTVRPIYAGNALATIQSIDTIKLITVRVTAIDTATSNGGNATIDNLAPAAINQPVRFVSEPLTESERPELTTAKVVVSGGRGLGSSDNFRLIEGLDDILGGAVAASRSVVDAGIRSIYKF